MIFKGPSSCRRECSDCVNCGCFSGRSVITEWIGEFCRSVICY